MTYFCLSGFQHSTYYPGGIWAQRKGDVDGANEHSKMVQSTLIEQIGPPGPSWALLSQHPPWEIHCQAGSARCCAPHPLRPQIHISWVSLWPFPHNKPSPELWHLLYERTGKNSQARFVLSFRLSWEIDFYLKDPTWIGCLDFSHRSQITVSMEKSHYFCPKERQTFSKVL